MRLSNYLTSIDWDYRKTRLALRELQPLHATCEQNLATAEREVDVCASNLQRAMQNREQKHEAFRDTHETYCFLRSKLGEFEEELFANAEEAEDWKPQ